MRKRLFFLLGALALSACASMDGDLLPRSRGSELNSSAWPLNLFSGSEAAVFSETRSLQYYFVCQTKYVPTPEETNGQARWKVNFLNFTKQRADVFDGDTTSVIGAAGIIYDELGGWFLVVPVVDRISGDCGITREGLIYLKRGPFADKLGDGLIRCKYKHPNPTSDPRQDLYLTSDMTLIGIPEGEVVHAQRPK